MRTPRLRRSGARFTRAGCQAGANKNVTPVPEIASTTVLRGALRFRPRPSSTSAEPTLPLALRLPCLATFTPHDAAVKATAVEILNVSAPSPPVPHVSTIRRSGRAQGRGQAFRRTAAMAASSSATMPLDRRPARKPPVCTGVSSSASQACISCVAWFADSASPCNSCSSRAGQDGTSADIRTMR